MKSREENWNKDIREARTLLSENWVDKVTPGNSAEFIRRSLFYGIMKMQRMVDVITFNAAYSQKMKEINDHDKAVLHAERMVVRTQSSGVFGDRSSFERGTLSIKSRQSELTRSLTPLMSYFITKNNLAFEQINKTNYKKPGDVVKLVADLMMLYTFEALIAGAMLNRLPDEESDEGIAEFAALETIKSVGAGVPLIREFMSEAQGFRGGGIISQFPLELVQAMNQISQGEFDAALVTQVNDVGGQLFHYPSGQINKFIRTATTDEEIEDWREYLLGPKWKD